MKAVIFDMDGVLCDSEPLICEAAIRMFAEQGRRAEPHDFHPFVGMGEIRYLGGVAEAHGWPLDIPAAKRRTYELYLELVPGRLQPFPGALSFVQDCRNAGLRTAVASSADRIKVRANLSEIALPFDAWDAVVTAEDAEKRKPAPDLFLTAALRMGVAPADCVVVEDAPSGIQAALAAGMACAAVAQTFAADRLGAANRVVPAMTDLTVDLLARL